MPLSRHLLRNEVLNALKANLEQGVWKGSLPSERQLTEHFQVSRGTLRYALKILQEEGVIRAVPGSGYRIEKRVRTRPRPSGEVSIGLLVGSPLQNRGSRDQAWLPALQQRLARQGRQLHLHVGMPEMQRAPRRGLKKLFKSTDHRCWLLLRCDRLVQQFFQESRIPAILCGSPYKNVELPGIDIDFKALGCHAAGLLISKKHKRLGFVCGRNPWPGDQKLLQGFREGIAMASQKTSMRVFRYLSSDYNYRNLIGQVKKSDRRVTAVFVDCPYQYLNLFHQFLKAGISVPEEVSLICRQDADFLKFLKPSPAHYTFEPDSLARWIQSSLEARIQGDLLQGLRKLIVPEFRPGESLSYPRRTETG